MANEIAIRLLAKPGQLVAADERAHVIEYEIAGMAALSGAMAKPLRTEGRRVTPELIRDAAKAPGINRPELGMLVLENTHNLAGAMSDAAAMRAAIDAAHALGLGVHVDGARLWNARWPCPSPAESLAPTPRWSRCRRAVLPDRLAARRERGSHRQARRVRSQFGGGWRQAGIVAAAGLVALDGMIPRLAEDHANAKLLAEALATGRGVEAVPPETNIVIGRIAAGTASEIAASLQARGVLATPMDRHTLRFVTHHDVSRDACVQAAGVIREVLQ
jgi:threonine aldolase